MLCFAYKGNNGLIISICRLGCRSPNDSCLYLVREHNPQALTTSFDELQLFDKDQAQTFVSVCAYSVAASFVLAVDPVLVSYNNKRNRLQVVVEYCVV